MLVEAARLQKRRLYVTFVYVKKAFPYAKRQLRLQIFSQKVASDELVRANLALYHEAHASVRGPEGYGLSFPVEIGTREGGAESPHLYMIFVCNLIAFLNSVSLRDGGAFLNGVECRALQLADDLAIFHNPQRISNYFSTPGKVLRHASHRNTHTHKKDRVNSFLLPR